ncbi:condensation domain-containing protein, partial [Dactylosporangium darangshiense]|uniref:condensation domain-containing protein n=1 Tax=Dactylosporangium darangshiense TaxID=579108 RepID=UPI0031E8DD8E
MTVFRPTADDSAQAIEDIFPLTAVQQGMLFHTRLAADPGMYWSRYELLLEGELDLDAFQRACAWTFDRHAMLRSTVVWDDVAEPLWVVSRRVLVPLEVLDWSALDEAAQEESRTALLADDWRRGVEFDRPSLVRATLIRLAPHRHRLLWSFHHIVLDGWSVPLVLNGLLDAYLAYHRGTEPTAPPARPFRDYVAWSMQQDAGAAEAFWRERLHGFGAATSLRAGPGTDLRGNRVYETRLSADATAELTAFARRHRLTLNTVVQGAFARLLSAYSGEDDVVFGVTSSGRGEQLDDVESIVGSLITTIPARIDVDSDEPEVAWLQRLQREQIEARRYEHTPLSQLAGWTAVPNGQPLFTAILVFGNYPRIAPGGDGELRIGEVRSRYHNNYPFTLSVTPGPELSIAIDYDQARFEHAAIERIAAHLTALLTGSPVSSVGWDGPVVELPAVSGVDSLFRQWAAATPDAVAVVCGEQSLTYAELATAADQLATQLVTAGAQPGEIIGFQLDRSVDIIVAILGIWRAGGIYLALDPTYPQQRLTFMITDSGARHIIDNTWLHNNHPNNTQLPDVDKLDPGRAAYLIYTSGTTGIPKGVLGTHRGLLNLTIGLHPTYNTGPGDTTLQFASFSFDAAAADLALTLTTGATLAIATTTERTDPTTLTQLLHHHHIRHLSIAPTLLTTLDPTTIPTNSHIIVGSETLPPDLAATWTPHHTLHNAYGPTETTVCATTATIPTTTTPPPIGR